MNTQAWLIFEADAPQSYIDAQLAQHPDTGRYFLGCPPFLQQQAADEGWTFEPPHVWVEMLP